MKDIRTTPDRLDRYDLKILRELAADARLSGRDLAERVGLSLTPTLRRLRRLETERYIRGYGAQLDEQRLAGEMSVFIAVTLEKQSEPAIAEFERAIVPVPGGHELLPDDGRCRLHPARRRSEPR